jgi:hypothetical protein
LPLRELGAQTLDEAPHSVQRLGRISDVAARCDCIAGRLSQVEEGLGHLELSMKKLNAQLPGLAKL